MPTYFQGSVSGLTSQAGLTNPFSLGGTTASPSTDGGSCCCPSSTKFLETLTDKLIDMAAALQKRITELESRPPPGTTRGVIFADISVGSHASVKYEYVIYIQRYGPPINGIFDPIYLDLLRAELAASTIIP